MLNLACACICRISSNNSSPTINRLPHTHRFRHLLFLLSRALQVEVEFDAVKRIRVTIEALTPRILTLKSNQGGIIKALKMPWFTWSLVDLMGINITQNIWGTTFRQWAMIEIIAPFLTKIISNRPRLLFNEILRKTLGRTRLKGLSAYRSWGEVSADKKCQLVEICNYHKLQLMRKKEQELDCFVWLN